MRFLSSIFVLALLSACATAAPDALPSRQTEATSPAYSSLAAQLFASAGRADAPNQAEVERALGAADITRREGAGLALTYRLETCALLLLFSADARNEMRLAEVHPSARTVGSAAPSLEQCATEASARRT